MMISIMHAQTWNEPLTAFIAQKCTMFDNFEEENKHEYVQVHNEFKSLVDNLLAAHLLEVDIMPEEFEKQLVESGLVDDPRLQQVVQQLMAAEDFMTFKTMMVERHTTMQQQAEANFVAMAATEDEIAAQRAAFEAQAAETAARTAPAAAPTYAAPSAAAPPMPAASAAMTTPSISQERAFGAAGGSYGRAQMPTGHQAPASKQKADAIRKALVGALKPR